MIRPLAVVAGILSATVFALPALAGNGNSLQIIVSKERQSLVVYDGDQVIASSRVSTGKDGHTTPSGIFSILEKQQYHESNLYSNAPMPWMQRLTWSGIALHESSSVPNYPASHGCVRMPAAFARALYQITDRGAHVIITDREMSPFPISHPALFRPEQPVPAGQVLSDAELRPTTIDGRGKPTQVALADNLPKVGATAKVVIEDHAPLRILITRRTERDTIADVQRLLTGLGFDAGALNGQAGKATVAAINGFKRWKGLSTKTRLINPDFLDALYQSAGETRPLAGKILVRQKFKPVLEADVDIREPERALGTHFFDATKVNRFSGKAEWHALTLENRMTVATASAYGIQYQDDIEGEGAAERALDRIVVPDNIRHQIGLILDTGSSITITDNGVSNETGQGTDFITLTRKG